MVEDPRDTTPPGDEPEEDEISLDELDESGSRLLRDQRGEAASDDDEPGEVDADEISFDELDDDAAGFFEVAAVPAPPSDEADGEAPADEADEEMYEVRAAPAEGQAEPEPQPRAESERSGATAGEAESIRRLQGVEVEVIATLGATRMQIRDILGLQVGSVVELHRMVGEPVDVTLNGRLIARGEVVVVDEKFAVRVNELASSDE